LAAPTTASHVASHVDWPSRTLLTVRPARQDAVLLRRMTTTALATSLRPLPSPFNETNFQQPYLPPQLIKQFRYHPFPPPFMSSFFTAPLIYGLVSHMHWIIFCLSPHKLKPNSAHGVTQPLLVLIAL